MFTHRKYSCFTQLSKNSCHPHYEIYIYEVPDAHHWGYIANLSHLYLGCLNENSFNFKHINLPEGGRETCINDTYSTLLPTKNPWTWICYAQKPSNYHPSSLNMMCAFSQVHLVHLVPHPPQPSIVFEKYGWKTILFRGYVLDLPASPGCQWKIKVCVRIPIHLNM